MILDKLLIVLVVLFILGSIPLLLGLLGRLR